MPAYDNTNTGTLFRNDKKGTNPKAPDHKGTINIDGVEYNLAAWVKEGKPGGKMAGKKFFSLKVEKKEQPKRFDAPPAPPAATGQGEIDEDVPF